MTLLILQQCLVCTPQHHERGVGGGSGGEEAWRQAAHQNPGAAASPCPLPEGGTASTSQSHLNKLKPQPSPACRPEHTQAMSMVTSISP